MKTKRKILHKVRVSRNLNPEDMHLGAWQMRVTGHPSWRQLAATRTGANRWAQIMRRTREPYEALCRFYNESR